MLGLFCLLGIGAHLVHDAYIHNKPVLGGKHDIITTHPERYRNYLETQRILRGENRLDPAPYTWEAVHQRAQEAIERDKMKYGKY